MLRVLVFRSFNSTSAKTMSAVVLQKEGLVFSKVPIPSVSPNEILIKISYAALNRRDYWITKGMYPKITFGGIMGSDCCGRIVEIGNDAGRPDLKVGDCVVVNPTLNWHSGTFPESFSSFQILGMDKGTFAEYLSINARNVFSKPSHLNEEQAAALPLTALTAFRALTTRGGVVAGNNVLVTGAGSGVSTIAVQLANALGASVWVTSSSASKIEKAVKELGARGGVLYNEANWNKTLKKMVPGGFDAVIDGASGDNINLLSPLMKCGGRIVIYGTTAGAVNKFETAHLFLQQASILGSTMGSTKEFEEMLKLVEKKQVIPVVDCVEPISNFQLQFDRIRDSTQFGKLLLKC